MKNTKLQTNMNRNFFTGTVTRIGSILLLIMPAGALQGAFAQGDFGQVLLAMKEKYRQMEKAHIVMQVQVFEDAATATPFYNEKVEIRKDNQRYRYHYGDQDMLMNERYLIMVDRTAREIVCNKRNIKAGQVIDELPGMNMDSLFSYYGKPEYMGKKGETHHYKVSLKDAMVTEVNLFIDTTSNLFRKIDYRYRDGQHAVITFHIFDMHPTFESDTFDEQFYVSVSQTHIRPSRHFPNYEIVNVETENETSN